MNPEPLPAEPEPALEPEPVDPAVARWLFRRANRPFRSAFRGIIAGERERAILLSVGIANAKAAGR